MEAATDEELEALLALPAGPAPAPVVVPFPLAPRGARVPPAGPRPANLVARTLLNKLYGAPALEAEEAAREMGLPILETRIPRRIVYDEAFSRKRKGLPPRREAGQDIAALYSELRSLG
mgnify:CR=1 FL=1